VRVDLAARTVTRNEAEVRLTPTEFRLLATLVRHAGKVLTHRQLLREVWGPGAQNQNHVLRVYVNQLRHKLEPNPAMPTLLVTETGVGYRLRSE
jgi:two-component system KDP operon response regulator KdpE